LSNVALLDTACERARHALEATRCIHDALEIRRQAAAEVEDARLQRDAGRIQQWSEIAVRAGRRCGELLRTTARAGERAPPGGGEGRTLPTLETIGIKKGQAYRFQKLASIPADQFEAEISAANDRHGEVSTIRILRIAATGSRQGGARPSGERSCRPRATSAEELAAMLDDPAARAELVRAWMAFNTHIELLLETCQGRDLRGVGVRP
jgi:hypothetical protein